MLNSLLDNLGLGRGLLWPIKIKKSLSYNQKVESVTAYLNKINSSANVLVYLLIILIFILAFNSFISLLKVFWWGIYIPILFIYTITEKFFTLFYWLAYSIVWFLQKAIHLSRLILGKIFTVKIFWNKQKYSLDRYNEDSQ